MRKIILAPGEFYHVYNRGNDKRQIFMDLADHRRFVRLLFFCNSKVALNSRALNDRSAFSAHVVRRGETLVDIGAYCLMPNHFHVLLRSNGEDGLSQFMLRLCTAYSMYFNAKYGRTGKLFEGPFQARHADSDEYLKYLFAYIHMNPVKLIDPTWKEEGIADPDLAWRFIQDYGFSSHADYLKPGDSSLILNKGAFPAYFEATDAAEYISYMSDWFKA